MTFLEQLISYTPFKYNFKKNEIYSIPIECYQIKMSYKIVGYPRMNGQLSIFPNKKINIIIYGFEKDEMYFDIHKFTIKLIPYMDKLIIIGASITNTYDIFLFLSSKSERDKCIMILELIGCKINDNNNNLFLQERRILQECRKYSLSLPNMKIIPE